MSGPILRVAAKAVIINNEGKVLIVREGTKYVEGSQIGLYGLPGGRLDIGESFYDGLAREVNEETGLKVEPLYPLFVGEWRPDIKGVPHQIIAIFMACRLVGGDLKLSNEHDGHEWINPKDYTKYAMMDPDDRVIEELIKRLK